MLFLGRQPSSEQDIAAGAELLEPMMGVLILCASGQNPLPETSGTSEAETDAQSEDASIEEDRATLDARYEAELERIHTRPIMEWPIDEFEALFTFYCRKGGGTSESCSCAWEVLRKTSESSAVPYLASRSEGDDVFQRLTRDDFYSGLDGLGRFNTVRDQCG